MCFVKYFVDRFYHRVFDRYRVFGIVEKMFGPIAHFHRISAARNLNHGRIIKVARKPLRIDGRRGDDDFQIAPLGQQLLHIAQQEIDVETAFMRFVDDQRVVFPQQMVAVRFGQQNAIGHHLHECVVIGVVVEANLVAY